MSFIPNTSILYIENFIDEELLEELKGFIASDYDEFYAKELTQTKIDSRSFFFDEKYNEIVDHIYQKASLALYEYYGTGSNLARKDRINHFYPGKFLPPHVDNHFEPEVTYGSIFYINDGYEGGEVFYPELDLEIRPAANSFIIHPASPEYLHAVKEVTHGDRFNITFFGYPSKD